MNRKITAIITAAGTGSRFSKSGMPKQYVNLSGRPIILYSLIVFQKCKSINEIIIAAGKEHFELIHKLAAENNIIKLTKLVEGGRTRFISVRNAFMQAEEPDIVVIHDAVRPNIDAYFVERLIIELKGYDGVVPGIKIAETVKRAKNNIVKETVDRENLFAIQTPQVFNYRSLSNAYKKAGTKIDFTDEAALAEYTGYRVKIAEGMKDNIKVTVPDDIKVLKILETMRNESMLKKFIMKKR